MLASGASASPAPETGPELGPEVRAHIQELFDAGMHTSLVIGLIDGSGERFFSFGEAVHGPGAGKDGAGKDGAKPTPAGPDSIFEIGSITKVFNALLLAHMAERDLLEPDDALARHLPEGVRVPERGRPIRLADLATHHSGLPRLPNNFEPKNPQDAYGDYGNELLFAFLAGYELPRDVGESYEYSNLGAGLLGVALAHRGGEPWESLIRSTLSEPLGLGSTTAEIDGPLAVRMVWGHGLLGQPVPGWTFDALAGAGALRASARDLLRFVAAQIDPPEGPLGAAIRATHARRHGPEDGGVALGWHLQGADGKTLVWHNGGTGGFRSFAGFVAGENRGVVVLTNNIRTVDGLGFHLLAPSLPLPEVARKKIPLFAED